MMRMLTVRAAIMRVLTISIEMVSVLTFSVRPSGGGAPSKTAQALTKTDPSKTIIFFSPIRYHPPMFRDLPIRARELKATPEILERIYEAARLGLRGESLALAAGMLPAEFARLKIMDPIADIAEMKGRADSELEMSRVVFDAAQDGDSKAALEFLKHRHDWVATQKVEVQGSAQISITVALEEAQKRVERITAEDVVDIAPRSAAVLPLARETLGEAV
jgi:hypothetical protein